MQSFESIASLVNREALYAWLCASYKAVNDHERSVHLTHHCMKPKSDMELLGSLLSSEILKECLSIGNTGVMLLSFVLRHQATLLNQDLDNLVLGDAVPSFLEDSAHLESVPVVGFSPRGLFFFYRQKGYCRAFDEQQIPICLHRASKLYCAEHLSERIECDEKAGSVQAQMRRFYREASHINSYTEAELDELVGSFWTKVSLMLNKTSSVTYHEALKIFDLSEGVIDQMSSLDLQKAYYQLCHKYHPDAGGDRQKFHTLKESYEILKGTMADS